MDDPQATAMPTFLPHESSKNYDFVQHVLPVNSLTIASLLTFTMNIETIFKLANIIHTNGVKGDGRILARRRSQRNECTSADWFILRITAIFLVH